MADVVETVADSVAAPQDPADVVLLGMGKLVQGHLEASLVSTFVQRVEVQGADTLYAVDLACALVKYGVTVSRRQDGAGGQPRQRAGQGGRV